MKTKMDSFEVLVPNLDGTSVERKVKVKIPLLWDEEFGQWVLGEEAHRIIDDAKAQHMGLLLPAQLKELRQRLDFTQTEMGEIFQVGEKSWTRWESGKQRASRSINLLIRALYDREISVEYLLKRAGKASLAKVAPTKRGAHVAWVDVLQDPPVFRGNRDIGQAVMKGLLPDKAAKTFSWKGSAAILPAPVSCPYIAQAS